ncbi:MAG: alpha/beta fold hydrolase [Rhodothermales bacterium]|nr:alpha/beta fold hydrolase [Rhodothermales bacterium]
MAETALQRLLGLTPFPEPPLIKLRYPVVMMHGFGMVAALRRNGHLYDFAMDLRSRGVLAFAPNVPPYNPVPVRAAIWKDRLQQILERTGAEKVNLIAHSMGGLDARFLISREGFNDRVASLVTVATPHHGSAIASFLLDQPDRLRIWLADLANWLGTNTMREVEADFLTTVTDLAPAYMQDTFNRTVLDAPDVRYWSFAARAGKGTGMGISPFLRPLNAILYGREGINDGFVSVESARWGECLGILDADHAQQLGIQFPSRNSFDAFALYRQIAEMLSEKGL